MKTKRNLIGKINGLALVVGAIVVSSGCESNNPTMPQSENSSQTLSYDARNHMKGFGEIERISKEDSPVYFHELFKTSDGKYFIGRLGAGLYALDAKNGQLLDTFAHGLTKTDDGLRVKVGALEYSITPPSSFSDFDADRVDEAKDWVPTYFEERVGGIFAKGWK